MAIVLCLSTVGAGAASNLFGALADDWHASRALVELTNGWLGGIVSAAGAVAAGSLIKRLDRRLAYGLFGALTAATRRRHGARAPRRLVVRRLHAGLRGLHGMAYAAFSAFAFETIGTESVATKYNIMASLLNLSIVFKTRLDGRAHTSVGRQRRAAGGRGHHARRASCSSHGRPPRRSPGRPVVDRLEPRVEAHVDPRDLRARSPAARTAPPACAPAT